MSADISERFEQSDAVTWEAAVAWLRSQPDMARVVRESYLGEDVTEEAIRFGASSEFRATTQLLNLGGSRPRTWILELGAGNGIAALAFARMDHEVVALDPDLSPSVGLKAIRRAREALGCTRLRLCCGVGERLPFADASFDLVYARQTLHHVRDLSKGLAECCRVLRPGGRMLAVREHVVDDEAQLEAFLRHHPLHHLYGGEHAYRLEEYLEAARRAGLQLRRVLGPYDSVINSFPKTTRELREEAIRYLARKLGRVGARMALALPPFFHWYLARMSRFDRTPGRLYSFLWVRPEVVA